MTLVRPIVWQIAPLKVLDVTSPRWACCLLRQAVAAFAFMLAAVPAPGQATQAGNENPRLGSIHGTLTTTQEDTSSGLAGISVKLTTEPPDGSPLTADTDDAGHYEFKDLKPGTYTISITQPGFKPFTKSLSINAGEATVWEHRGRAPTGPGEVEGPEENECPRRSPL